MIHDTKKMTYAQWMIFKLNLADKIINHKIVETTTSTDPYNKNRRDIANKKKWVYVDVRK